MAPPSDPPKPTGAEQWQKAIDDYQRRKQTIPERLGGFFQGLPMVAEKGVNASLPGELHAIYQQLQAGVPPEALGPRSFLAAMRMMDYGLPYTAAQRAERTL